MFKIIKTEIGKLPLFIAIAVVIVNHFTGFIGYTGYDDIHYSELAVNFLKEGKFFEPTDFASWQMPVIWLTSLSYFLFGINDFAGSFMPLLSTIGTLIIMHYLMISLNGWVKTAAFGFFIFTPWILYNSDKILPDPFMMFFITAAFYFYLNANNRIIYALLFSGLLFLSFLTKITAIYLLPVIIILFIRDLAVHKNIKFWLSAWLSFIILIIIFMFSLQLAGTSPGERWMYESGFYRTPCAGEKVDVWYRLYNQFGLQAVRSGLFTLLVFYLPIVSFKTFRQFKTDEPINTLSIAVLVILISLLFIPFEKGISLLCLQSQHFLFLVPFLAIIGAVNLHGFIKEGHHKFFILFLSAGVAFIANRYELEIAYTLYLFLFVMVFGIYLASWFSGVKWKLWILLPLLCVLIAEPVRMFIYARSVKYSIQKNMVDRFLKVNNQAPALIISDEIQKQYGRLYTGFDSHNPVQFLNYMEVQDVTLTADTKIYMLMNPHTLYLNGQTENDLPVYAQMNKDYHIVSAKEKIRLYELPDSALVFYKTRFTTKQWFSSVVPGWQGDMGADSTLFLSAPFSGLVKPMQYSSTFSCFADSLFLEPDSTIVIKAGLFSRYETDPRGKLAISANIGDKVIYFESVNLEDVHKERRKWKQISLERPMKLSQVKGCTIKVFFWNVGLNDIWIDDFEVSVMIPKKIRRI